MVRFRWAFGAALLLLQIAIAAPARADRDLVGVTHATFAWSASSGPVLAYRIYVERNDGGFLPHASTPTTLADNRVVVVSGSYGDVIRVQVAAVASFDEPEGPRSDPSERIRFLAPPTPAPTPTPPATSPPAPGPTPPPTPGPTPPSAPPSAQLPGAKTSPDFDGDGQADLLLREGTSGSMMVWYMAGDGPSGSARVGELPTSSAIAGNGDYDGDGHADLLTRDDTTTAVSMQLLVDGAVVGGGLLMPALSPDWEVVGSGDFDVDGRDDILLRNASALRLEIWSMNGPEIVRRTLLRDPTSSSWQAAAVADFDGDDRADILWYSTSKQEALVSLFRSKMRIRKTVELFESTPLGDVVATGDADGNGLVDVVVRTRDTGHLRVWFTQLNKKSRPYAATSLTLEHEAFLPSAGQGGGLAGFEVQAGGDFDGDRRMDLLLRDTNAGDLRVWFLDRATVSGEVRLTDPSPHWVFESVGAESPSTHR